MRQDINESPDTKLDLLVFEGLLNIALVLLILRGPVIIAGLSAYFLLLRLLRWLAEK